MNWQPIETATEGHQVLLAWGIEASGPIGYAIATKHGEQWIDQHCKRVDIDGYCVIAWQTLPPLPNVNDGQLRRFFGRCEDCGKKVKVLRGGQCALCHAAHPKMPNNAEISGGTPYRGCTNSDLPWSVFHPDAGDVGMRTPRFATEAEARAQARKWNRNHPGHVVVGHSVTKETDDDN